MPKKSLRWVFILPLIVFIGLLTMLALRLGKPTDIVSNTATGRQLPTFSLPLLSDVSRVITNKDLPNSPYLLNIWGSWCATCHAEHPFLMTLHAQDVPMVGVNYKDNLSDAIAYLARLGDPFVYSIQDYKGGLALDLGLMGAPETFVVDGSGKVRLHIVGELHESNWAGEVKPCLDALNDQTLDETAQSQVCTTKEAL